MGNGQLGYDVIMVLSFNPILRVLVACMLVCTMGAPAAAAEAFSGRAGITWLTTCWGADLEWHLPRTPGTVHFQASAIPGWGYFLNAWGHYQLPLGEATRLGVLAGLAESWREPGIYHVGGPALNTMPPAALLGVSLWHRWGNSSLRLTPNLAVYPWTAAGHPQVVYHESMLTVGPPWLEVGYRLTPSIELSARTSFTPLCLSYTF